ncbi:hypothetical protein [Dethiosulfovibrio peptidovorans]|nr:hypothetical protein [Dethiosulfovibrio peptidovorans]
MENLFGLGLSLDSYSWSLHRSRAFLCDSQGHRGSFRRIGCLTALDIGL